MAHGVHVYFGMKGSNGKNDEKKLRQIDRQTDRQTNKQSTCCYMVEFLPCINFMSDYDNGNKKRKTKC